MCSQARAVSVISNFERRYAGYMWHRKGRKEGRRRGRNNQGRQQEAAGWERKLQKKREEEMILESVKLLGPIDMGKFEDFDSPAT